MLVIMGEPENKNFSLLANLPGDIAISGLAGFCACAELRSWRAVALLARRVTLLFAVAVMEATLLLLAVISAVVTKALLKSKTPLIDTPQCLQQ
jgi:hypothetical protein